MTYYLLETTLNGCVGDFFFLQLIYFLWLMARQFYYITIDLTVNVRLSDAAHLNMNQKYVFFFFKNTNFRWAFHVNIVDCLYFLDYT